MNPRHRAFVNAYLGEAKGNGTKAAIIAGYSEATARQAASRLLTRAHIKQALEQKLESADLTTQARLQRLGKIADTVPDKFSGADVLKANELILRVNGALHEKADTSNRVTVTIGFLGAPQPATAIQVTAGEQTTNALVLPATATTDAQVMPRQPHVTLPDGA